MAYFVLVIFNASSFRPYAGNFLWVVTRRRVALMVCASLVLHYDHGCCSRLALALHQPLRGHHTFIPSPVACILPPFST